MHIIGMQSAASAVPPSALAAVAAAVQAYLDNEAHAADLVSYTQSIDDDGDAGINAWRRSAMFDVFDKYGTFAARPRSWTGR